MTLFMFGFILWQRSWKLTLKCKPTSLSRVGAVECCPHYMLFIWEKHVLEIHMRQVRKDGLISSNNLRIIFMMIFHMLTHCTHICHPFDQNCIWEHFFLILMPNAKIYTMNGGKEVEGLKSEMTESELYCPQWVCFLNCSFHSSCCGFINVAVLCL